MHEQARTILNGDVKNSFAQNENLRVQISLMGSANFQNKGTCWKDIPHHFFCLFRHVSSA